MAQETGNYIPYIHDRDYNRPYLDKRLDRSTMICDSGREKESLNGWWRFGVDQYDTCLRARWYEERAADPSGRAIPLDYSFDSWEQIAVPSCWNLHAERLFWYEGSVVYTRTFRYVSRGEKRVFLRFGGVGSEAKVFLNRRYLGKHRGGSTPFFVEVTAELEADNRLLVVANNSRRSDAVPCENTDWFNYGGIHRDVELIRLPESFIRSFGIALVPGSAFARIRVDVEVEGRSEGSAELSILELGLRAPILIREGRGSAVIEAAPELWSPERPRLYEAILRYRDDEVRDRVGFREIAAEGQQLRLNGEPLFLKGICTHEESVANGRSLTEEEIVANLTLAKELGCNYLRLAHYPHSERVARLSDELGLLLWEEVPVYWAIDFDNPDTYANAENQLAELIERDRNRASVILWSVGNENADTDSRFRFMSSLARKAKELDPTRLVTAACLIDHAELRIADRLVEHLDVIGVNEYYGWYEPDFAKLGRIFENSTPTKPVIVSEFGADARPGFHGTVDDLGSEECQLAIYRKQLSTLGSIPSVRGMSPWILYDFRSPRRLHETQNYYNIKGLLSADKGHRKLAFDALREFYRSR